MNARKVRSYEVMRRLAHVRESQASLELAAAIRIEDAAAKDAAEAEALRVAAADARYRCLHVPGGMPMGEYALLTTLCDSLHEREAAANGALQEAAERRLAKAEHAAMAGRFVDRVEDELTVSRHALASVREGRLLADSLDLWVNAKEIG
jgi:hypothetical protein